MPLDSFMQSKRKDTGMHLPGNWIVTFHHVEGQEKRPPKEFNNCEWRQDEGGVWFVRRGEGTIRTYLHSEVMHVTKNQEGPPLATNRQMPGSEQPPGVAFPQGQPVPVQQPGAGQVHTGTERFEPSQHAAVSQEPITQQEVRAAQQKADGEAAEAAGLLPGAVAPVAGNPVAPLPPAEPSS